VQYLDLLDDLCKSTEPDPEEVWKPVAILDHSLRTHNKDDVHVKVKVLWSNGEETWVRVDALLVDEPIILTEYARKNRLQSQPHWKWTIDYANLEEEALAIAQVFKVSSRMDKQYKFGIEVPRSVKDAVRLDKINNNKLWQEAIEKELNQINEYKTFRVLEEGETLPNEYKRLPYHIVFDVKFDLRRKARLVAGDNFMDPPKEDVYSGVVSMDMIRLGFMLAKMNDLQICAADIGNAFLYGKTSKKCYIVAGPEFGEFQGQKLIIHKGLYRLRTSAARFHEHLAAKLRRMGYKPSRANADLYMKDCGDHYEYLATYVDDILSFSRDPMKVIEELKKDYILKGIGEPMFYLGGDIEQLGQAWKQEGIECALSASTYIKNSVKKVEIMVGKTLRQHKSPMEEAYHPELDDSPLLPALKASQYRTLIGMANWMIVLG
jgi:hypothetical protein